MKLDKNQSKLTKMNLQDDSFVAGTPAERVGIIWELTQELWSLRNRQDAEQRLQRDIAVLIKQQR